MFEDFRIRRQIIRNVKSADDIVLLAKEEKVVRDTLDRLIDIGLYCEMEINVEETEVMKISRWPFPMQNMIDQIKLKMWIISNYWSFMIRDDGRCIREVKSTIAKPHSRIQSPFHQQIWQQFRKKH